MEHKITIIIPTFRRPALLKKAVNSVLSQTYPHFEVCVYDNASCDETEEIMSEFTRLDSRVKYHCHLQNIGMMANYAYGFSKINTPFFSFLSDDDHLSPWFFETALEDFERFPDAAFTICKVLAVNQNEEIVLDSLCLWDKKGYFEVPNGFLELMTPSLKTPLPTCTLFNRKIIKNFSPDWNDEIQHLWDHDYFLQLSSRFPYVINEKACGFFLAHDGGFSSGFFARLQQAPEQVEIYVKAFRRLIQRIMKNPYLTQPIKEKAAKLLAKSCKELVQHYAEISIEDIFTETASTTPLRNFFNKYFQSLKNHLKQIKTEVK